MTNPEFIYIDGHRVKLAEADKFFNNGDGSRVTDEEWDESKIRVEEARNLDPEDFISRDFPEGFTDE